MSGTWGAPNVQPWRDDFTGMQQPRPTPVDDLSRFVLDRIDQAEREPSYEFPAAYDRDAGPMAHRYAAGVRRDMVAFRRIVAEYCRFITEADRPVGDMSWYEGQREALHGAVVVLANRFADHPDFQETWRLE